MKDFDQLLDPRQYYYGTYVIQRAKQQESQERNFQFVEKRLLLDTLSDEIKDKITKLVIPLRHFEWGANMNNYFISAYGYGAPITTAAACQGMDRLGNAQYITRIALTLSHNEPELLDKAKSIWMDDAMWQPLRKVVEDSFVLKDWFELHLLQNFLLDGLVHPLIFGQLNDEIMASNGTAFGMLTEFISDWYAESKRWTDATIKVAIKENDENKELIESWLNQWQPIARDAVAPLLEYGFGDSGPDHMVKVNDELQQRANKLGLDL